MQGYTSIERYNCRREKLEFSEIIDQYSPLSQPESGFDDSETKLDPNKVDETLDKPTEPRRRSAARRLSGTADIAAQHT